MLESGSEAVKGGARTGIAAAGKARYDGRSAVQPGALEARGRWNKEAYLEPTWHDGLSRKALVELVEALLLAMDKSVPRLDAIAHHLSLMSQQGEEQEVLGGISDQIADIGDELYAASDREKLREWGNEIDMPEKAH
jgi:hypothetical protein